MPPASNANPVRRQRHLRQARPSVRQDVVGGAVPEQHPVGIPAGEHRPPPSATHAPSDRQCGASASTTSAPSVVPVADSGITAT